MNNEHPGPEMSPDDPVPPDDVDGLQEAELELHGGNRAGVREDGYAGNEREGCLNPNALVQQVPPPHHGMGWTQQGHAVHCPEFYLAPFLVPYAVDYAVPFALPHPLPYAHPYCCGPFGRDEENS